MGAKVFAGQPEISELPAEREKSKSKSKTPDNAQNNKSLDSSTNKEKAADAQTTDKEDAEKKTSIPDSSSQHSDLKAGESLLKEKPLKLTVVAARKLKKSGLFGKADPYVAITYGSQKTRSGVIKNNLNPEWNFESLLTLNENASDEVLLEVYDKDTGSKDDFMGKVSLQIAELKKMKQGQWVPLQKTKSGEVCLSCDFMKGHTTSTATEERETFERVESVEELETATLTDLRIKKGGGIRAVKELLSAPQRSQEDLGAEPTEESSKELFLPEEIKS